MGTQRNNDFTEFPSILDDEEAAASNQTGIIGGFIGRFFRSEPSTNGILPPNVRIPPEGVSNGGDTDSSKQVEVYPKKHKFPVLSVSGISPARRSDDVQDSDNASINSEQTRKLSQRLSSLFKPGSKELNDYERSEFRRYWMPDSSIKECYECHEKFSAFRRKHHCRLCGQIFCGKCSKHTVNGAALGSRLFPIHDNI